MCNPRSWIVVCLCAVMGSGCVFADANPPGEERDATYVTDAATDAGSTSDAAQPVDLGKTSDMAPDVGEHDQGQACEPACGVGETCQQGSCEPAACRAEEVRCGERCVDTGRDVMNCGGCDVVCEASAPANARAAGCLDAKCVFECRAGWADANDDLDAPGSDGCELDVCGEGIFVTYPDVDGDTFGDQAGGIETCGVPADRVTIGGDCDDSDSEIYPGADEVCDGIDTDCNPENDDATAPRCDHVFFVTGGTFQGDFNTNQAADGVCTNFGGAIASYGAWKAVISTGGNPVKSKIRQIGRVVNVNGEVLWDAGTMFTEPPAVPLNVSQAGASAGGLVWTGSTPVGNVGQKHCTNFTHNFITSSGVVGAAGNPSAWLATDTVTCNNSHRIYCISGQ